MAAADGGVLGPQAEVLPGMERDAPTGEASAAGGRPLTEEQEQAVGRRTEALILSAAAGSGKTSVLVERFVRAVRDDGIAPARILAITFTERAAGELRGRVRERLLELGDREAARDTEAAFVGTFHGFCARLLRAHPLAAGLDPEFAILDEGLAGRLRELAFKPALREFTSGERGGAVDLLAAYGVDRVHWMIDQVHRELRSRGQRQPRLPVPKLAEDASVLDVDAARACGLLDELLERFGGAYEQLKRQRAAVDFDDLELLAGELLAERESLRAAWSERFELLMVDEFQDTNPRQLAILRSLERGNLFTVGDELQSIYGFRHADVRLFRELRAKLRERGASLELTQNFRSREPLLEVVNAVFAGRFADYVPLVAARQRIQRSRPTSSRVSSCCSATSAAGSSRRSSASALGRDATFPVVAAGGGPDARRAGRRAGTGRSGTGRGCGRPAACLGRSRGVRARAPASRPANAGGSRRILGSPADRRSDLLSAGARQPARRGGAVRDSGLAAGRLLEGWPGPARARGPEPRRRRVGNGAGGPRGRRSSRFSTAFLARTATPSSASAGACRASGARVRSARSPS